MRILLLLLLILIVNFGAEAQTERPPISPAWVFDHWIWEDGENTAVGVNNLVRGYRQHKIPVGVVIIDSPWATEYNNFRFNRKTYPSSRQFISKLHRRGIKVVLWVTSMLNNKTLGGKHEPSGSSTFAEARRAGYLANSAKTYRWWKGQGGFLDYANPAAVAWWHSMMDRVMSQGVDGWKVDVVDRYFPLSTNASQGALSRAEYKDLYYSDMYDYSLLRNPNSAVLGRSIDLSLAPKNSKFTPISKSNVSWVGDQDHSWKGLRSAIRNVLQAARLGYAVIGSDIGGFNGPQRITKELLLRWAQFGALCPLMENGGEGAHAPWLFDQEAVGIYRYFVKLHLELKPYFYSLMMQAHLNGTPILRPTEQGFQYTIGESLLVSPVISQEGRVSVDFPAGQWRNYWQTQQLYSTGSRIQYRPALNRYPLFVKAGSIIPLDVRDNTLGHGSTLSAGNVTVDVYPGQAATFTIYSENHSPIQLVLNESSNSIELRRSATNQNVIVRILLDSAPQSVMVDQETLSAGGKFSSIFDSARSYYFQNQQKRLYILIPAGGDAVARIST